MKFVIDDEEYVTQEEIEAKIGLKQSSINTLVRFGHFPKPIKLDIRKLWKKSDIEEYLKEKERNNSI